METARRYNFRQQPSSLDPQLDLRTTTGGCVLLLCSVILGLDDQYMKIGREQGKLIRGPVVAVQQAGVTSLLGLLAPNTPYMELDMHLRNSVAPMPCYR